MNNKIFNGMKYLKKNLFKFILVAFMLVLPILSLAVDEGMDPLNSGINPGGNTTINNPIKATTFSGLLRKHFQRS